MKKISRSAMLLCAVIVYSSGTLADYSCKKTSSSFLWEVCYDANSQKMRLNLSNNYYNYCHVPEVVVNNLLSASSKGSYFNSHIRGRYDC